MKKNLWVKIILFAFIIISLPVYTHAMGLVPVTSFDNWQTSTSINPGPVSAIANGATVNLSAQGNGGTGKTQLNFYKTGTTAIIGMVATLQVITAINTTCSAYSDLIGIKQFVGKMGNEKIRLMISLKLANNKQTIWYQVTAVDLTTNVERTISSGIVGDLNSGWNIGDAITVAFAQVDSESLFYVDGFPQLITIQAFNQVTAYNEAPTLFIEAAEGTSSMAGTVSNLYLITP